jgi:hypothetical protein
VTNTQSGGEPSRHALHVPAACGGVEKSVSGLDLQGTERFRCRLLNTTDATVRAAVELDAQGATGARDVEVPRGGWNTVDLSWREVGFESAEQFQGVGTVRIRTGGAALWVDDVSFRRPPRRAYEVFKLIHCAVPTLAGLIAAAACLLLLRFEEVGDIARWVKERGWRRRKGEVQDVAGEP